MTSQSKGVQADSRTPKGPASTTMAASAGVRAPWGNAAFAQDNLPGGASVRGRQEVGLVPAPIGAGLTPDPTDARRRMKGWLQLAEFEASRLAAKFAGPNGELPNELPDGSVPFTTWAVEEWTRTALSLTSELAGGGLPEGDWETPLFHLLDESRAVERTFDGNKQVERHRTIVKRVKGLSDQLRTIEGALTDYFAATKRVVAAEASLHDLHNALDALHLVLEKVGPEGVVVEFMAEQLDAACTAIDAMDSDVARIASSRREEEWERVRLDKNSGLPELDKVPETLAKLRQELDALLDELAQEGASARPGIQPAQP